MKKQLGLLIVATAALWAVASFPASLLFGREAFLHSLVAMLICLPPAVATLWFSARAQTQSAEKQFAAMVGGMGVRMVFVLGLTVLLYASVEALKADAFWIWVIFFYLATLAGETMLLHASRARTNEER